ncbi:MAG: hypothetical protein AB1758_17980 [Candidatus Eremiobacterota bacterium]
MRRGMTVVELLVASATLLLVMSMVAVSVVSYLRAYHRLAPVRPSTRSLTCGLEHAARLLRSATAFHAPEEERLLAGYRPVWGQSPPLVLVLADGKRVGLALDPDRRAIVRLDYPDPLDPAKLYEAPGYPLGDAADLWIRLEREGRARFLRVRITGQRDRLPFETRVRFRPFIRSEFPQ